MDDKLRREIVAGGDGRLARFYGRKLVAGPLQLIRPGSLENGAADPAAHYQARIGGIDDGVYLHVGDVLPDDGKGHTFLSLHQTNGCSRRPLGTGWKKTMGAGGPFQWIRSNSGPGRLSSKCNS